VLAGNIAVAILPGVEVTPSVLAHVPPLPPPLRSCLADMAAQRVLEELAQWREASPGNAAALDLADIAEEADGSARLRLRLEGSSAGAATCVIVVPNGRRLAAAVMDQCGVMCCPLLGLPAAACLHAPLSASARG